MSKELTRKHSDKLLNNRVILGHYDERKIVPKMQVIQARGKQSSYIEHYCMKHLVSSCCLFGVFCLCLTFLVKKKKKVAAFILSVVLHLDR